MLVRLTALALTLSACDPTEAENLARTGTVQGAFEKPEGLTGSAWLFLFEQGQSFPTSPAFVTAISEGRLRTDSHFVFAQVKPNPWQLFGLLDANGNFDPTIDVLSQPNAGDRIGSTTPINVQPGRGLVIDYAAHELVLEEPPAFHFQDVSAASVSLDLVTVLRPLTLVSDSLGYFNASKTQFHLALVDANADGRPDLGAGGLPALSLTIVLHWLPRPGQAPKDTNVVVPMAFNPAPILTTLNGQLSRSVSTSSLQIFPLPQAQEISVDGKGNRLTRVYGSPPFGDYELLVLTAKNQFWRMPNQLGATLASQSVKLHFERASP